MIVDSLVVLAALSTATAAWMTLKLVVPPPRPSSSTNRAVLEPQAAGPFQR